MAHHTAQTSACECIDWMYRNHYINKSNMKRICFLLRPDQMSLVFSADSALPGILPADDRSAPSIANVLPYSAFQVRRCDATTAAVRTPAIRRGPHHRRR
jgi:hypothetical protein